MCGLQLITYQYRYIPQGKLTIIMEDMISVNHRGN